MKKLLYILITGLVFFSGCIGGPSEEQVSETTLSTVTEMTQVIEKPVILVPEAEGETTTTSQETTTTAVPTTTVAEPKVREFDMTAKRYSFNPSTIRVKQGDLVKIRITSTDVTHGFALGEYDINVKLSKGETKTVEFTANKKGTFTFYCSVYCGSGHGRMKGELIVE